MYARCSATKGSISLAGATTRLIATNRVFFNIGASNCSTAFRVSLESHPPACSPKTIPNKPSRATIGGAGLFTRITHIQRPIRPTANEMSNDFISIPLLIAQTSEIFSVQPYSKLSTCFAFACLAATRLCASTAFSNGTTSIGGGFNTPASKPGWSPSSISATCSNVSP